MGKYTDVKSLEKKQNLTLKTKHRTGMMQQSMQQMQAEAADRGN